LYLGGVMRTRQLNPYAQKWLLDSFYGSIANGGYTSSRISEERAGYYHKKHAYTDLLSTMYVHKKQAIGLDESGFKIEEQIQTGFQDKEVLAAMYDNIKNADKLDNIGISYDMQAKLGKKLGKSFQGLYDKTEELEGFVNKNHISPILLTGYLMNEGNVGYLVAEGNPVKASEEIDKIHSCNYFLQTVIPEVMAGMFCGSDVGLDVPEDVGKIIGQNLVDESKGAKDFRTLVRLSEVNRGALNAVRNR